MLYTLSLSAILGSSSSHYLAFIIKLSKQNRILLQDDEESVPLHLVTSHRNLFIINYSLEHRARILDFLLPRGSLSLKELVFRFLSSTSPFLESYGVFAKSR